jgi:hypothetical protein
MRTVKLICNNCGVKFEKPTKEITRQIKNGRKEFYCSLSCSTKKLKTTTTKIISKCLWCKKEFETTTHKKSRKCCSINCARKYSKSKAGDYDREKQSIKIKKLWDSGKYGGRKPAKLYDFVCVECGRRFQKFTNSWVFENKPRKTCSEKCYKIYLRRKSIENPNCGGETGYKHYQYKNVWMDSSWEVELANWMDENNIKWERSRKKHMFWWTDIKGDKRRYYPDFYLPELGVYLDPKNKYKLSNDQFKLDNVLKENKMVLLYGDVEKIKIELFILKGL